MEKPTMEPTYSSNQAAQMVGVKPASLRVLMYRLKQRNRAEVGTIEGKTRRFTEGDITKLREVRGEKGIWDAPELDRPEGGSRAERG